MAIKQSTHIIKQRKADTQQNKTTHKHHTNKNGMTQHAYNKRKEEHTQKTINKHTHT